MIAYVGLREHRPSGRRLMPWTRDDGRDRRRSSFRIRFRMRQSSGPPAGPPTFAQWGAPASSLSPDDRERPAGGDRVGVGGPVSGPNLEGVLPEGELSGRVGRAAGLEGRPVERALVRRSRFGGLELEGRGAVGGPRPSLVASAFRQGSFRAVIESSRRALCNAADARIQRSSSPSAATSGSTVR